MRIQNVPIEGYSSMSIQCAVVIVEVWCEWLVAMWTGRIKRLCCDLKEYFFFFFFYLRSWLTNILKVFVNKL